MIRIPSALAAQFPNDYTASALFGAQTFGGIEPTDPWKKGVHLQVKFDSHIMIDNHEYNWYYGLDTAGLVDGQYMIDFLSVALHEIGHGLGFLGRLDTQTGHYLGKDKAVYDFFPSMIIGDMGGDISLEMYLLDPGARLAILACDQFLWWTGLRTTLLYADCGPYYRETPFRYPGIISPGYPMLYSRSPISGRTYDHFDTLMEASPLEETMGAPGPVGSDHFRNILGSSHVLADCGWSLKNLAALIQQNGPVVKPVAGAKSGEPDEWLTILLVNTTDNDLQVTDLRWYGAYAMQYGLMNSVELLESGLPAHRAYPLEVSFSPAFADGQGGKRSAYLRVDFGNDGAKVIPVEGYAIGEDADGDLIADSHECEPAQEDCSERPFLAGECDSSGDEGSLGADGIRDGDNDYDGDGVSNAEETAQDFDPLDPMSVPTYDLGDGLSQAVTVTNPNASWPMSIESVELTGVDADQYFISAGDQPRHIPPKSSTKVWVAFFPTSVGDKYDAALRIHYNNGVIEKMKDLPLRGRGVLE